MMFGKKIKIRDKGHLKFVASLPCIVTGFEYGVQAHHLLRTPEKGMGTKSGDNYAVPLNFQIHDAMHLHGDETKFFQSMGIDDMIEVAFKLYEYTRDEFEALRYMQEKFSGLWTTNRGLPCTNRIQKRLKPPLIPWMNNHNSKL